MSKEIDHFEREEIIRKLSEHGFGEMIKVFLENDEKIYTKKNRLNKSGACRSLGWKPKLLDEALERCKQLLEEDDLH